MGSFGLFFTCFLIFCRFAPVIAIAEVKGAAHLKKRRFRENSFRGEGSMSDRVLLATFEHEDDLLAATDAVRRQGLQIVDAFTPYAVHGLDRAMGLRPSRLTWVCFVCGMTGAIGHVVVRALDGLDQLGNRRRRQAVEFAAFRCTGGIRSGRLAGRVRLGVRSVCRQSTVSGQKGTHAE